MTTTQAIEGLPTLLEKLDTLRQQLAYECEEIAEQWQQLGRIGGQRDDHAAALLSRLGPHLGETARFATACTEQIAKHVADPFGRNG